jgi:NAD(P)-dependent dehydrogenase (short-subunit alcohol dehydrogenase family)
MEVNLHGKIVMVTGGGRGIGRSVAQACAGRGATLILLARTQSELQETVASISDNSPHSYYEVCDVSNSGDVRRVVGTIVKEIGRIDGLVNLAAVQSPIGRFTDNSLADWWRTLEINLYGTVAVIKEVLPVMMRQGKGKVVNFAGGGATSPRENFSAYAISKTAVVRLTETLALELKEHHIDVNAVAPGAVNTKMLTDVLEAREAAGRELVEAARRKSDGGDNPLLAADLVSFLLSEESDGITGKLISAKWDPWRDKSFQDILRNDADIATLRRIDLKSFYRKQ